MSASQLSQLQRCDLDLHTNRKSLICYHNPLPCQLARFLSLTRCTRITADPLPSPRIPPFILPFPPPAVMPRNPVAVVLLACLLHAPATTGMVGVTLQNAAAPGVIMPAMGLGTGGYGNKMVAPGVYPECWSDGQPQPDGSSGGPDCSVGFVCVEDI